MGTLTWNGCNWVSINNFRKMFSMKPLFPVYKSVLTENNDATYLAKGFDKNTGSLHWGYNSKTSVLAFNFFLRVYSSSKLQLFLLPHG